MTSCFPGVLQPHRVDVSVVGGGRMRAGLEADGQELRIGAYIGSGQRDRELLQRGTKGS